MAAHPLRPSPFAVRVYIATLVALTILNSINVADKKTAIGGTIAILAAAIVAGLFFHYRFRMRAKQKKWNEQLSEKHLVDGEYFLYLRSFAISSRRPVRSGLTSWAQRSMMGNIWDLEHALSDGLANAGSLVAIGDKSQTLGAGKVTPTDAEWKNVFWQLANGAKAIFVVPHSSPSSAWELEQIFGSELLLQKTIFIQPPFTWLGSNFIVVFPLLIYLLPRNFIRYGIQRREWTKARNLLRPRKVELPEFSRKGVIFKYVSSGQSPKTYPVHSFRSEYLNKVVSNDNPNGYVFKRRWFDLPVLRNSGYAPGQFAALIVASSLVWPITAFLFAPYSVPSSSMWPTLASGDFMMVAKYPYGISSQSVGLWSQSSERIGGNEPELGDVVAFLLPKDLSQTYVQRVIGLPGDEISLRRGAVYINKRPVKQVAQTDHLTADERYGVFREVLHTGRNYQVANLFDDATFDNFGPVVVPDGHYFLMGDNRDNSYDSRALDSVGFVPARNILGRVSFLHFSIAGPYDDEFDGDPNKPWYKRIRWDRIFKTVN